MIRASIPHPWVFNFFILRRVSKAPDADYYRIIYLLPYPELPLLRLVVFQLPFQFFNPDFFHPLFCFCLIQWSFTIGFPFQGLHRYSVKFPYDPPVYLILLHLNTVYGSLYNCCNAILLSDGTYLGPFYCLFGILLSKTAIFSPSLLFIGRVRIQVTWSSIAALYGAVFDFSDTCLEFFDIQL